MSEEIKPKFLGQIKRPHKGMILYRFHTKTKEITEAVVVINKEGKKTLSRDEFCIYFWSLNEKNAKRKLEKAGFSLSTNEKK